MTTNRSEIVIGDLTDITAIAQSTWVPWPNVAPLELPQVPGDYNTIGYTLKGNVSTNVAEDLKFKFIVEYDDGATFQQVTHETGLLHLGTTRFHHQVAMKVVTPTAGDGKLIFKMEAFRNSNNGTGLNLTAGRLEVAAIRAYTGGVNYWSDDGIAPVGAIFHTGDIWFDTKNEMIKRWDGSQWVSIIDYTPLTAPADTDSNKVGFY